MMIDQVLKDRTEMYGDFKQLAKLSTSLKTHMSAHQGWHKLQPYQQESLDMIVHKIARIINGDHNNKDSWVDIAGYAQLVVKQLEMRPHKPCTPAVRAIQFAPDWANFVAQASNGAWWAYEREPIAGDHVWLSGSRHEYLFHDFMCDDWRDTLTEIKK